MECYIRFPLAVCFTREASWWFSSKEPACNAGASGAMSLIPGSRCSIGGVNGNSLQSITNSQSLLKLTSIELVTPSNHLILCCPLCLLPSIFPSIKVFSNELALCIRWPKYWSFSFNISPCNEYSRLISFRMDWLDLLAVQGTLKSLLQHHSSKASILRCSAFFMVHSHIHTWLLEKS